MNTELSNANLRSLAMAERVESANAPAAVSVPIPDPVVDQASPKKLAGAIAVVRRSWQWVLISVLTLGAYMFFSRCVFQSVQVVGASMLPTLHDADRYFLNRWAYYIHSPQHQDIVVLKDPTDGVFAVKRVIATPGEAIYFKKGQVFVNGAPLMEPYLANGTRTFTYFKTDEALILCGEDQYFVLGDNRGNSFDSRMYGPVRRGNIMGAIVR